MPNYRITILFFIVLAQPFLSLAANIQAPAQQAAVAANERAYKRYIQTGVARAGGQDLQGQAKTQFLNDLLLWAQDLLPNTDDNLFPNLEKNSLGAKLLIKRREDLRNNGVLVGPGNFLQNSRMCQESFDALFERNNHYVDDRKAKTTRLINHAYIWWGQLSILRTGNNFPEAWEHLKRVKIPPYTRVAKLWRAHLILINKYSPTGNQAEDLDKARRLLEGLECIAGQPPHALVAALGNAGQNVPNNNPALVPNPAAPIIPDPLQPAAQAAVAGGALPTAPLVHPDFLNDPATRALKEQLWGELHDQEAALVQNHQNQNAPQADDEDESDSDSSDDDDDMMDAPGATVRVVSHQTLSDRDQLIVDTYCSLEGKKKTASETARQSKFSLKICLKVLKDNGHMTEQKKSRDRLSREKIVEIREDLRKAHDRGIMKGDFARLGKKYGVKGIEISKIDSGKRYDGTKQNEKQERRSEIIAAFHKLSKEDQKQPLPKLKPILKHSRRLISKTLKEAGLWTNIRQADDPDTKEQVIKAYKNLSLEDKECSINTIVKQLKINKSIVSDVLHDAGLRKKKSIVSKSEDPEIIRQIKEEFHALPRKEKRGAIKFIAEKLNINMQIVSQVLEKEGLRQKPKPIKPRENPEIIARVVEAFDALSPAQQKKPVILLKNQLGLSDVLISDILHDQNLRIKTVDRRMENDPEVIDSIKTEFALLEETQKKSAVKIIADTLKFNVTLVSDVLEKEGLRKKYKPKLEDLPENIDRVVAAFSSLTSKEQKKPVIKISGLVNLSPAVVSHILQKKGLFEVKKRKQEEIPEVIEKILEAYDQLDADERKTPLIRLEKLTGISRTTVANVLDNQGVGRRRIAKRPIELPEPEAKRPKPHAPNI